MKQIFSIILFSLLISLQAKADMLADWQLYATFDANPTSVRETRNGVYFTASAFDKVSSVDGRQKFINFLFYYDKEGDEIVSLHKRNILSGTAVDKIAYNHDKNYLLVVYTDCNIDFLYDDGRVYNCVALKGAQIPGTKTINDITFSPAHNEVYLATSFGYVALDDNKYEVKESRNYGESLSTVCRFGDRLLIAHGYDAEWAFVRDPRLSLSDYINITSILTPKHFFPLDNGYFYLEAGGGDPRRLCLISIRDDNSNTFQTVEKADFIDYQCLNDGYLLQTSTGLMYVSRADGTITRYPFGSNISAARYSTYDCTGFWDLRPRLGMRHLAHNNGNFSTDKGFMRPNAPAVLTSTAMASHPEYGLLVGSSGIDYAVSYTTGTETANNLSGFNGGLWSEYSPLYQNPDQVLGSSYRGVSIDPANPDWIWRGSLINGVLRFSMTNPSDVLHLGNSMSSGKQYSNFKEVFTTSSKWAAECFVTPPVFDADQNLWMLWRDTDEKVHYLCYWPKADRLASTTPQTYRPFTMTKIPGYESTNRDALLLLNHSRNSNIALIWGNQQDGKVVVWNHNGTPTDTRDDKMATIFTSTDQDGGQTVFLGVNQCVEDPETGLVWILSNRGVFTFNPLDILAGRDQINRIKVARNDGTSLADYLLNEICTYSMVMDPEGRKWFLTDGAGVVCTSQDGRTILGEFTTENSYLPSNKVFAGHWDSQTNSLMLSTMMGLCSLTPSGSGKIEGLQDQVRIFPNPVEPDFHGYVRMDNIMDGSVVKIADSAGNIIREIGPVEGGGVNWDITGLDHTRVKTGVYYVMISPNASGEGTTIVQKILVLQ